MNQPIPVIVGPLETISFALVIINNTRYSLPSALKAVDFCFKCYHALNALYPVESEHVWLFLQKYLYNIETPLDKDFITVNKLISDIEATQ